MTVQSNAERVAAFRERLADAGGRRLDMTVPPEENASLEAEMRRTGERASEVVLRLIREVL